MTPLQNEPLPLMAGLERKPNTAGGLFEEGRIMVTPEVAQQIIDRFNYVNQRKVSAQHVAKLASEMTAGAWTPGSQIAFGITPDQRVHLVNGQHRLAAVIHSGVPIEFQLLLVPCADDRELRALYHRFDAVQRKRGAETIVTSTGIAAHLGISKTVANGAYRAGVAIELNLRHVVGANRPPHLGTPDGQLAAIGPWWDTVQQYAAILDKCDSPLMRRRLADASIMAVALVTLKHQPVKASQFWGGVAQNDGLPKGDPRRTLYIALSERRVHGFEGATMVLCSHAWNAWFHGRQSTVLRAISGELCRPAGTPFATRGK
jgi:hypothetical protein